jgi:hypothetical protein
MSGFGESKRGAGALNDDGEGEVDIQQILNQRMSETVFSAHILNASRDAYNRILMAMNAGNDPDLPAIWRHTDTALNRRIGGMMRDLHDQQNPSNPVPPEMPVTHLAFLSGYDLLLPTVLRFYDGFPTNPDDIHWLLEEHDPYQGLHPLIDVAMRMNVLSESLDINNEYRHQLDALAVLSWMILMNSEVTIPEYDLEANLFIFHSLEEQHILIAPTLLMATLGQGNAQAPPEMTPLENDSDWGAEPDAHGGWDDEAEVEEEPELLGAFFGNPQIG